MDLVVYNDIMNNCNTRKQANMEKINEYIERYSNWDKIILDRHVKFIKQYLINDKSVNGTAKSMEMSVKDLLSIFLRIESQFELYEEKGLKFRDLILSVDEL